MYGKIGLFGVQFSNVSMQQAVSEAERRILEKNPVMFSTLNIDDLLKTHKDSEFRKITNSAAMALPDSKPMVWLARFLGKPFVEQVAGSDFMPLFASVAAKEGYKLFFLGAEEGVASKAADVLKQKFPGLAVVGCHSPKPSELEDKNENRKIIEKIRKCTPDALFVAFGAPKQEKWIFRNLKQLNVPFCMGVGATFDFISGKKKRAPRWVRALGLEWLHRLLSEPKRLWKRYLVNDPVFLWMVLKEKISKVFSRH